jgi:four helix bundle protein
MEKHYDLEERTEEFAKAVIVLCKKLSKNTINIELVSQAIRASGSVRANYIEANESLSKKDFAHRIKIYRKEAKESRYWLKLISSANPEIKKDGNLLIQESTELMNIFGAILRKGE